MDIHIPVKISRSNDKKFICNFNPECRAAFSRSEHLQRHIRKHTGERPFSCECGRTFSRLDNLRQHAQTVHSGTDMSKMTAEQAVIAQQTKRRSSISQHQRAGSSEASITTDTYVHQPVAKLPTLNNTLTKQEETPLIPAIPTVNTYVDFVPPVINPQLDPSFTASTQTFSTYPAHGLVNYSNGNDIYVPVLQPGVESSVGSQPISSLAKRRRTKHGGINGDLSAMKYINGQGGHHQVPQVNEGDFTYTASYHTSENAVSSPSEGEQMSEYINNGQELVNNHTDRHMSIASMVHDRELKEKQLSNRNGMEAMNMLSELAAQRAEPRPH